MKVVWIVLQLLISVAIVAATMQVGLVGLLGGAAVGLVLPWLVRLARGRARARRAAQPGPLKWRPRLSPVPIVSGLFAGLGSGVLLQQYSVSPMTSGLFVGSLSFGLLGGIVLPSLLWLSFVRRYNRKLAAAPQVGVSLGMTVVSALSAFVFLVGATPALAELTGPCTGVFKGVNAKNVSSSDPDQAVKVGLKDSLAFELTAKAGVSYRQINVHYGLYSIVADKGFDEDDGDDFLSGIGLSVQVEDYAWMGAGLYKLSGRATLKNGAECEGALLIDVAGDPLETVAGAAAAVGLAAGIAGVMGGTLREGAELLASAPDGAAVEETPQPPEAEDRLPSEEESVAGAAEGRAPPETGGPDIGDAIVDRLLDPGLVFEDALEAAMGEDGQPLPAIAEVAAAMAAAAAPRPADPLRSVQEGLEGLDPEVAEKLGPPLDRIGDFVGGRTESAHVSAEELAPLGQLKHRIVKGVRFADGKISVDLPGGLAISVRPVARNGKLAVKFELPSALSAASDLLELTGAGEALGLPEGAVDKALEQIEHAVDELNEEMRESGQRLESIQVDERGMTLEGSRAAPPER